MAYLGKTPSQAVRSRYYFTATGGETSLSGADDNTNTLTFTDGNYVDVALNGVTLVAGTDYNTTTANTIGGLTALVASDVVEIIVYDTFSVFSGNVNSDFSVGGDLTITGGNITSSGTGYARLDLNGTTGGEIRLQKSGTTYADIYADSTDGLTVDVGASDQILFKDSGTERMRINSSGNVGIGTTSPTNKLHLTSTAPTTVSATNIMLEGGITGYGAGVAFGSRTSAGGTLVEMAKITADGEAAFNTTASTQDAGLRFFTAEDGTLSERMRITGGGHLLVGKTAQDSTNTVGFEAKDDGIITATVDGAATAFFNRKTSDGDVVIFRKDNTTVGNIGTTSSKLTIGSGATGVRFNYAGIDTIAPWNVSTNAQTDGTTSLGYTSTRFDDIYATNGTIQTSDQNEKQQIASLTDAEITAAKAISKLFKTFKWNDRVEAKGDAARTHTGVIAQHVQTAMTAAGLDAGDYAFFISSTWWETQTEVPAVEAVDAVLDEDGNVVTEAVEAVAAYTRTDTYDTAEEAPEGATERTRLGVRYPELLAFIGAATEQRLSNIETRLEALETA